MERMGSKIIETKFLKFKDHVIMDNLVLIFNVAKELNHWKKWNRKITFLNLLTGTLPLDGGKVVLVKL
jgi:ATP-binding cassette subfamily F protein uup